MAGQNQNQKRNTLLFVGLLVLGGVIHIAANILHNTPVPHYSINTMLFCLEFAIYTLLLFFWLQSVRLRLLPTRAKTYMIILATQMVAYLSLRAFKYRIAASVAAMRYAWYIFYVPMILIPTLFLMVCIRIARGEKSSVIDERFLTIPAGLLSLIIATNDLHRLVFKPKADVDPALFYGQPGTYTYGITFYLTYAWMILMILIGVILLIKVCGSGKNKKRILIILADILLCYLLLKLHDIYYIRIDLQTTRLNIRFIPPYESPEIHVFCMLAAFEYCIRERLIPHNKDYEGHFSKIPLPVLITGLDYAPAYSSANEVEADRGMLEASLSEPCYPQPDRKLSGRRIHGGYAFWTEDESEVRSANERLQEANELLESENTLIEYENKQKEENAYLRSRHHIYHEIAEKMYPYQKRIEEMLNGATPGSEGFYDCIAEVSVLNAYVKRKTNLLLLASENETIEMRELQLAVSESARYLTYAGLRSSVDESGFAADMRLPADTIISLYDTFERIIEQILRKASLLMVSCKGTDLTMATDSEAPMLILTGEAVLPITAEKQENILYLTIHAEKGGD
ncbi:MAG: hypothetical protein J5649_10105 [Lachnospiraceae bacterium]|nr:hypothetical protein [Lachnospiraceae bacterium]